ncbi:MAG: glycosyltransferase [Candidatus Helarchaeota archaeon]
MNGAEVVELNFQSSRTSLFSYPKAFYKILTSDFDSILIGYSDINSIENFLAKVSSKRPIFFDAFFSQYDSLVIDRKIIGRYSPMAKYLYHREAFFLKCVDCVILDTNAHIKYFHKLFPSINVDYERVFVGADDSKIVPKNIPREFEKFVVFFYGTYIPLHGIQYIMAAAKELEKVKDIIFILVGGGQTFGSIQKMAKRLDLSNVKFLPPVSYSQLVDYMNQADVCLGIFGTSRKSANVIPNKVYDALAVKKPIITRNSSAIREALDDQINCILCKPGNGKSLADAILLLKNDEILRKEIAINGYKLYKEKFTPKQIGKSLLKIMEKYI